LYDCEGYIDLYCKRVNLPFLFKRKDSEFNWKEKQYVKYNNVFAVIGSFHVVELEVKFLEMNMKFDLVFKNSHEEKFIDYA
jgi:hypothetical protein